MNWKFVLLALALVFALCLGVISVRPTFLPVTDLKEQAGVRLSETAYIPLNRDFDISGLSISGYWEGPGRAQVWLINGKEKILVFDTEVLLGSLEFSSFGSRFDNVCVDSCSFSPFKPGDLFVLISGPGFMTIDEYNFAVPLSPTGLASCENCKKVQTTGPPDHRLILMIFLLLIFVFGAHALGHVCQRPKVKIAVALLFIASFITLTFIFGVSIFSPTSAFTLDARRFASIFAAVGTIVLIVIGCIELFIVHKKIESDKSVVWNDLEKAEDEWCK